MAIPNADAYHAIEAVAHSLFKRSCTSARLPARPHTADLLRERIQQSVMLIRTLANEAASAIASSAAAQRPRDLQDQVEEMCEANDVNLSIAKAILQTELDGIDLDIAGEGANATRASCRLLTKRPRIAHSSDSVTKSHLKFKERPRPDAPAASPPS